MRVPGSTADTNVAVMYLLNQKLIPNRCSSCYCWGRGTVKKSL